MGENIVDTVEHTHDADPSILNQDNSTATSSSHPASSAPSSSRSTPPTATEVIPFDRVQKLEVHMATLINHVKPFMHNSIMKSKNRLEKSVDKKGEQKI